MGVAYASLLKSLGKIMGNRGGVSATANLLTVPGKQ